MEFLTGLLIMGVIGWLLGVAAGGLALWWGLTAFARRFRAVLALGILALGLGYFGMHNFHLSYSRSVNGRGWSVDSKWFFLAVLILGGASLLVALAKWVRAKRSRSVPA